MMTIPPDGGDNNSKTFVMVTMTYVKEAGRERDTVIVCEIDAFDWLECTEIKLQQLGVNAI